MIFWYLENLSLEVKLMLNFSPLMKNLRNLTLQQSLSKSDDFALSVEVLKMIPKQKEAFVKTDRKLSDTKSQRNKKKLYFISI